MLEEALAEVEKAKEAWTAAREAGKPVAEPRYRPAIYTRHPVARAQFVDCPRVRGLIVSG